MESTRIRILGTALFALLVGCDTQELADMANPRREQPRLYIAGGTPLQISENTVALVYGHDECPMLDGWLSGPAPKSDCVLLTGKRTGQVRMVLPDNSNIEEVWTISERAASAGSGFELRRPNGWHVRAARDASGRTEGRSR